MSSSSSSGGGIPNGDVAFDHPQPSLTPANLNGRLVKYEIQAKIFETTALVTDVEDLDFGRLPHGFRSWALGHANFHDVRIRQHFEIETCLLGAEIYRDHDVLKRFQTCCFCVEDVATSDFLKHLLSHSTPGSGCLIRIGSCQISQRQYPVATLSMKSDLFRSIGEDASGPRSRSLLLPVRLLLSKFFRVNFDIILKRRLIILTCILSM